MFLLVIHFLGGFGLPYPVIFEVTDEEPVAAGVYLEAPKDAVYKDGRLFIADWRGGRLILATEKGTQIIAKHGFGPGELKNYPSDLIIEDGYLFVFEWNWHVRSRFDLEGRYIDREKPSKEYRAMEGVAIRGYGFEGRIAHGHNFRYGDRCFFDPLSENTLLGDHLSRSMIDFGDDEILVLAKRTGAIATVTPDCAMDVRMKLNLLSFATDPIPSARTYVRYENKLTKTLRNGLPLIGLAVRDLGRAWVLIRNEHNEDRWLYALDIARGTIVFKHQLDAAFNRIRYNNGALILLAEDDAIVRCLKVE